MKISKQRKKELRKEYERIKGEEYVKGIEQEPSVNWFEWVELKVKKKG